MDDVEDATSEEDKMSHRCEIEETVRLCVEPESFTHD